MRGKPDVASEVKRLNHNVEVGFGQNASAAFGPFDQTDAVAQVIAPSHELEFLGLLESIQIKVVNRWSVGKRIRFDQGERRAFHRAAMPETAQHAAVHRGLAVTE